MPTKRPPMLSVSIDARTRRNLDNLVKQTRLGKSLIVRHAINYLAEHPELLNELVEAAQKLRGNGEDGEES